MKKHVLWAAAVTTMLTLGTPVLAQNLAIVNGKAVPKARMDLLSQQITRSGRTMTPEIEAQLREDIIAREIFVQEADKLGVAGRDEFKAQMELARQSILIRELFEDFRKKNPVSDAEVKAEYDKFVAASGGKEYKARHILVEKESEATAILASLKKGAKFEDLAKKQSKDPGSASKGGDLDWSNPASYVPEFGDALRKLNKGQTSDAPVKTQFGYHIIRVDDIRDAKLPTFEEVKPQITQQLQQKKIAAYQEELRKKAKVE